MKRLIPALLFILAAWFTTSVNAQNPVFLQQAFNTQTAATPTFSPGGGSYSSTQSVSLATVPAICIPSIVYNLTGATSGGLLTGTTAYTGGISVAVSETIYAQVQGCPSGLNSSISNATYTITAPPPCSPFTDPFSGSSGTALNSSWWTAVPGLSVGGGSVVQNSGVAQGNAAFRGGGAIVTACSGSTTPSVQFTVAAIDGENAMFGLISMTSAETGYVVQVGNSSANMILNKCTAGSCGFLGTAVCGAAFSVGNVFKASAVIVPGTSIAISVYRNGTLCGTITDSSSPHTSGYGGFAILPNGSATGDQISTLSVVN